MSTCATCDGFFFREKPIAVVGGGDSAIEEAIFLTKFATNGHRHPPARRAAGVEDHAGPRVREPEDRVPVELRRRRRRRQRLGRGAAAARHRHRRRVRPRGRRALFVAIGHDPNTALFRGQLDLDENGYIVTAPDSTRTSVEGVFAAGDVQDHVYRQAITAAGSGCMAAIEAERWLGEHAHAPDDHRDPARGGMTALSPTALQARSRSVDSTDLRKGPSVADDILTLSDATFDETVGGSDTPVLVDFWAEWCGPCKMIAPTLAEIAAEQRGKLTIAKLNVDDNPDTARRFDVMSIPTLLVFKDGEQVKRLVGAKGKGQLLQDLAEFIG